MFGLGKSSNEANVGNDAIAILTADHRKVDALFAEFESAERGQQKIAIATQICNELVVHATAEEDIFYPQALAALQAEGSKDAELIWEATVEHGTLEGLIDSLSGMRATDDDFEAHIKVLKEYVKHHVKEEENEIFPRVRRTGLDMEALGEAIAERKEQIKAAMSSDRGGARSGGARGNGKSRGQAREGQARGSSAREGGGKRASSGGGRGRAASR
jgi:hemerythrin superfamily protein